MKTLFNKLMPVLLMLLIIPACTEDEIEDPFREGFLEFSLNTSGQDSPFSRVAESELPPVLTLILSVEDEFGNIILKSEELKLRKWEESYITRPVRMKTGNYAITEFLILDMDSKVIMAAPIDGAPLAYLSDEPLPLPFRIYLGESTVVTPEVFETAGKSPQEFGYSQFSFEKVKTLAFEMRVYDLNRTTNVYELTTAHVRVTSNEGVELYDNDIDADVNEILIRDEYFNHTILVSKTNRITFDTVIVKNDLKKLITDKDGPLDVYLDDGMIFWNKLGSLSELTNSEVGPPLAVSVPNFAPAKFGNGLYPRYGSQIATMSAGEFNQYIPNPLLEPWTFEVWYKPDYSVIDNRIAGVVPNGRCNVMVANCWRWDRSVAGVRIMPIPRGYDGPTDVYADLGFYKSTYPAVYQILQPDIIDNDVSWTAGDLVHLAVVFNPSDENGHLLFQFWVNGVLHGHSSATELIEYAEPQVAWPIYVGGDDISRVANGVVDNLKIYNLAKTNFDDRMTE